MTILVVTAEYPPGPCGGIGIFYQTLSRHLVELGARVHVLVADAQAAGETRYEENGIHVVRTTLEAGSAPRLHVGSWRFDGSAISRARAFSAVARRLVNQLRPDIVETHDWSGPLWRPPAHPFVVRLHGASSVLAEARGERVPRLQRFLERRMAGQANGVIAVSEWVKQKSAATLGIDRASVEVIANGVDTRRFSPGKDERREEVVFAGSLREDKGVPELLRALEIVLRERPAATATLAGAPDSWGELPLCIRAQTERVQIAAPNRLRLLGRVSQRELSALYRRAGVCVFPSRAEAFGLACVEAMSCGAPVIASLQGAGAEIVENARSGLLADPRDPAQLAEAILRVLAQPDLGRALGAAAHLRAVERFSIRLTAERTLRFYEGMLRANQSWRKRRVA